MEIGRQFLEENSKYKELNGISEKKYPDKTIAVFEKMDIQS
jgi:hypothetical protein